MDFEIGNKSVPESVEEAIDNAIGTSSTDRIILTRDAAEKLLSEIDGLRDDATPVKPRFLHVLSQKTEQLVRVEAISCVAVDANGQATVVFAGGGVVGVDALTWRLLFSHIKQYAEIEMVPVAPGIGVVRA